MFLFRFSSISISPNLCSNLKTLWFLTHRVPTLICVGKPAEDENVMHFKKYRNLFNRLIRQAKAIYYTELFETHKESIKGTWWVLNDVIGKSRDKTCCTSMNIDGQSITNAASISNKFCDYFMEVGAKCAAQIPMLNTHYTQYLGRPHSHSIYLDPVTPGDIINIMNKMKGKSSTGHDSISSKLLKSVRGEIAYPLFVAINSSLHGYWYRTGYSEISESDTSL